MHIIQGLLCLGLPWSLYFFSSATSFQLNYVIVDTFGLWILLLHIYFTPEVSSLGRFLPPQDLNYSLLWEWSGSVSDSYRRGASCYEVTECRGDCFRHSVPSYVVS